MLSSLLLLFFLDIYKQSTSSLGYKTLFIVLSFPLQKWSKVSDKRDSQGVHPFDEIPAI